MKYKEIDGDLIQLAKQGMFDVIAHGCNCMCTMGAGIAPQMAKAFGCDKFPLELEYIVDYSDSFELAPPRPTFNKGNINKLGQIDYLIDDKLAIVNCYTQYNYGKNHADGSNRPLDYDALALCLKKINHIFKGKHIGVPRIGCGLAGGNWRTVQGHIQYELKDMQVTVVNYKAN